MRYALPTLYRRRLLPVTLAAVFTAFVFANAIAAAAWRQLRVPQAALYLPHTNAALAAEIGGYYFGIGAYDLERAERGYRRAVAIDPNIRWGHYQLGRIYFIRGEFDAALAEVNEELRRHPENTRSHYVRGLIRGYRGDLAAAEGDFSRFVAWAPREWAGYNDLAWIQARRQNFPAARETIRLAFERIPSERNRNPWLWTNLGVAELNRGRYTEAKEAFQTALRLAERMDARYFWSAYPGNDPASAESAFGRFRATAHMNLALAHEALGEQEAAAELYRHSLALLPDGPAPERSDIRTRLHKLELKLDSR